jgi:hypothetical protein
MADDQQVREQWQVPDTPADLLDGPSQDEVSPQSEADSIRPRPPRPSWQDKLAGRKVPRAERPPKPVPPKPKAGTLVKPFTDLYTSVGTMILPFDQVCGMAVINNAEDCAKALDSAARENPAMRRVLLGLIQTSIWGQLIAAHLPIMMAIAMHHVGPVKEAMQGVPIVTMPQPRPDSSTNGHGPYG